MKNTKTKIALILALSLGAVSAAWSYTISGGSFDGTDVGSLDTFIAEDVKKNNPTNELAWVNTFLNPDVTYNGYKTETVNYFATEDSSVFAFQLASDPGYYIIKNATRIALFENLNNYGWGVFNVGSLSSSMNISGSGSMTISHVTEFGSKPNEVSEPASLALLGLGLLGLAYTRKKQSA